MKQMLRPLLCLVAIATSSYAETDPGVAVTQYLSSTNLWPMEFV